jgi:uncharacterized protein (DUF433 family)
MASDIISSSPDVMSGTPVFAGTRVPEQSLIDCLEAGDSIGEFLNGFPTVSREQAIAFLEEAKNRMIVAAEWRACSVRRSSGGHPSSPRRVLSNLALPVDGRGPNQVFST